MQLSFRVALGVCLVAAFVSGGCGSGSPEDAAESGTLTLFIPCGMEMPFMELKQEFARRRPEISVRLAMDNAAILVDRVLVRGDRPDLVMSPGGVELERLVEAGRVREEDVVRFGRYELLLFGPRANRAGIGTLLDLRRDEVRRIVVADPERTSVGRFSRQVLEHAGLWDELQAKIEITEDAMVAYKLVMRGEADAGFAYRSCPLKTAPGKVEYAKIRIFEGVSRESYGPAYASAAVLAGGANEEAARAFAAMLLDDVGQAALRKYDVPALSPAAGPEDEEAEMVP